MSEKILIDKAVIDEAIKTITAYLLAFERERPMFTPRFGAVLTTLADALKEPEHKPEPVAWLIWLYGPVAVYLNKQEAELEFSSRCRDYPHPDRKIVPLYIAPPEPDAIARAEEVKP